MGEALTFTRIGAAPGERAALSQWPWGPRDVLLTEGMRPLGAKYIERGGITAGEWACNAGSVEIGEHPVDEACFVTRGTVTLTDAAGRSETFRAGEAFLIPRGFRGTWSHSDDFAKWFVAVSRD
jgi:uncharacterized cupin superfamily protein